MPMLQHSCATRGLVAQMISQSSCGPRLDATLIIVAFLLLVVPDSVLGCYLLRFSILNIGILQEHGSVVKAIYTGSEFIATASDYEDLGLVLESTSFYAEQGGQVQLLHTAIFDIDQIRYLELFLQFTTINLQQFQDLGGDWFADVHHESIPRFYWDDSIRHAYTN